MDSKNKVLTRSEFSSLYLENYGLVRGFLYQRCKDSYVAEDLAQETFIRAYQSWRNYNGSCKLSVWLCAIAKHLLYRHYTAQAGAPDSLDLHGEGEVPSAETTVIDHLNRRAVYESITALPEPAREIVRLRLLDSLSFAQIAALLGMTESNARVIFFRAKLKLKEERDQWK